MGNLWCLAKYPQTGGRGDVCTRRVHSDYNHNSGCAARTATASGLKTRCPGPVLMAAQCTKLLLSSTVGNLCALRSAYAGNKVFNSSWLPSPPRLDWSSDGSEASSRLLLVIPGRSKSKFGISMANWRNIHPRKYDDD